MYSLRWHVTAGPPWFGTGNLRWSAGDRASCLVVPNFRLGVSHVRYVCLLLDRRAPWLRATACRSLQRLKRLICGTGKLHDVFVTISQIPVFFHTGGDALARSPHTHPSVQADWRPLRAILTNTWRNCPGTSRSVPPGGGGRVVSADGQTRFCLPVSVGV